LLGRYFNGWEVDYGDIGVAAACWPFDPCDTSGNESVL
jgi:hypothetical protein